MEDDLGECVLCREELDVESASESLVAVSQCMSLASSAVSRAVLQSVLSLSDFVRSASSDVVLKDAMFQ